MPGLRLSPAGSRSAADSHHASMQILKLSAGHFQRGRVSPEVFPENPHLCQAAKYRTDGYAILPEVLPIARNVRQA